jgi:hypothetical protein
MPLSEREQRQLEQIELALERDDPQYVATVNLEHLRQQRLRSLIVPALIFLLGTIVFVGGLVTTHAHLVAGILISVTGVLAMTTTAIQFLRRQGISSSNTRR